MNNNQKIWRLMLTPNKDPVGNKYNGREYLYLLSYCKEKGCFGAGWPIDNPVLNDEKAHLDATLKEYGTCNGLTEFINDMNIDDLVWITDPTNYADYEEFNIDKNLQNMYLCRVTSDWYYHKDITGMIVNMRDCRWSNPILKRHIEKLYEELYAEVVTEQTESTCRQMTKQKTIDNTTEIAKQCNI